MAGTDENDIVYEIPTEKEYNILLKWHELYGSRAIIFFDDIIDDKGSTLDSGFDFISREELQSILNELTRKNIMTSYKNIPSIGNESRVGMYEIQLCEDRGDGHNKFTLKRIQDRNNRSYCITSPIYELMKSEQFQKFVEYHFAQSE